MEGLADDINGFSEQSLRVSQWDIQLRENQRVRALYLFISLSFSSYGWLFIDHTIDRG